MPAINLTETEIRNLAPRGEQYDVYDKKQRGLIVRVNKDGSKTYTVQYTRGRRKSIGDFGEIPLSLARQKAMELCVAACKGEVNKTEKGVSSDITFQEFLDTVYLPWLQANHESGIDTYKSLCSVFGATFGKRKLSEITVHDVEKWKNNRAKNVKKATVNRNLAPFKAIFSKAFKWKFISQNPIAEVARFDIEEDAVVRYLALDDEEPAFYKELKKIPINRFRTKVTLGVRTGARRNEIRKLKLNRVDLRRKTAGIFITGKTTKSKRNRFIPLGKLARVTLYLYLKKKFPNINLFKTYYSVKPSHNCYIFTNEMGQLVKNQKRAWERLLRNAAITKFRYHDMRHEFASNFIMKTGDLYTLSQLLGHSTTQITERVYAHLAPKHVADQIRKLD